MNDEARTESKRLFGRGRTKEAIYRGAFLQTAALFYQDGINKLSDGILENYYDLIEEFGRRNYDKVNQLIEEWKKDWIDSS